MRRNLFDKLKPEVKKYLYEQADRHGYIRSVIIQFKNNQHITHIDFDLLAIVETYALVHIGIDWIFDPEAL